MSVGTASATPTVSFGQAVQYATNGPFPFTQVVADLNKDGNPDLVVANSGNSTVSVLLGDGQGRFAAGTAHPINGDFAFSVATGDVDGDGNPDVASANTNSETVSVLLGDGTGALGGATTFSTGTSFDLNPTSVGIADMNGDGKSDLVVANSNASTIAVLLSDGLGGFAPATEFPITRPFSPITMRIADFNRDGRPDVVAGDGNFSGFIALLLGDGSGGFASTTVYASGVNNVYTIALGDMNKDGIPDVAIGSGSAAVAVMLGDGVGGLGAATSYPLEGGFGSTLTGVTVADFNGDGNPDVLTPGGNADLSLWLGDGTGALGPSARYNGFGFVCCGSPSGLASGDLNKDGLPDIIGADGNFDPGTGSGTISVSLNTTAPDDTTPPIISVPSDITVEATNPSGAVVSYTVTATDPDDAVASLDCIPASGSTFAIGTTTVNCTASDTHDNTSNASFTIHVKSATEQLADLLVAVTAVGPGMSLADKVTGARAALSAGDIAGACSVLNALILQLKGQSGKSIPTGVAASLVRDATRIRAVLGC